MHFKNSTYYIDLPWHKDRIKTVPSNYQVVLKALDKTVNYLETKKLNKGYDAFYQQEEKGIIERIEIYMGGSSQTDHQSG